MLTVSLAAYTLKAVAVNYTLETLTGRGTYYVYEFAFSEKVNAYGLSEGHFTVEIFELNKLTLSRRVCFRSMAFLRFVGVPFFFIAVAKLNSGIAVILLSTHLRHYAWASFDDCDRDITSLLIKDACHPYFFTYQS
jgi:hypothetical protein